MKKIKPDKTKIFHVVLMFVFLSYFSVLYFYNPIFKSNGAAGYSDIKYNDENTIYLIKKLSIYQGDSIFIDDKNRVHSANSLIESVINQVYLQPNNLTYVIKSAEDNNRPIAYYAYKLGIELYIQQYGKDTLRLKTNM